MRFVVGNRNHRDTVHLQMLGCLPRFNITASNQRSQPKPTVYQKNVFRSLQSMVPPSLNGVSNLLEAKSMCSTPNQSKKPPQIIPCAPKTAVPASQKVKSHTHANHRWIHQGLTDCSPSIYQNLIPRFLSFLSCFSPLISILFAYPVAIAYPVPVPVPVPYPVPVPVPIGKPLLPGMGYGAEGEVVGVAALEAGTVTVTVTCAVVVTVTGEGQLAPDPGRPLGLIAGRLERRAEEVA